MPLVHSWSWNAISDVYKNAIFVINLCKKDYNFTMHTCKQIIDWSQKQPRPILQDQDRKISVSSGLDQDHSLEDYISDMRSDLV